MAQSVYWGCDGCGKEFGPEASEEDIPAGHVCSAECAEKAAKKLDKEQQARDAEAAKLVNGTQEAPKFYSRPE